MVDYQISGAAGTFDTSRTYWGESISCLKRGGTNGLIPVKQLLYKVKRLEKSLTKNKGLTWEIIDDNIQIFLISLEVLGMMSNYVLMCWRQLLSP